MFACSGKIRANNYQTMMPISGNSRLPPGWHDWAARPRAADTQAYFYGTRPVTATGLFKMIGGIKVLPGIQEYDDEVIYPEAIEYALAQIAHVQSALPKPPHPYGWKLWAASERANGVKALFCGTKAIAWTELFKKPELSSGFYKTDMVPNTVYDSHEYTTTTNEVTELNAKEPSSPAFLEMKEFGNMPSSASPCEVSRLQFQLSASSRNSHMSYETSAATTTSSDGSTEDDYLQDVHIDTIDENDITIVKDALRRPILLGVGAYGKVYLGHLGGVKVVIKKLSVDETTTDAAIEEAKLQKHLEAEHIVPKVLGISFSENSTCIIQEFIEGCVTLEKVHRSLTSAEWSNVLLQTAHGIKIMHELAILHNDIKEDNILLQRTRDGLRVLLIDFGLASYREGQVYECVGEEVNSHLAPEVFHGRETMVASDIYSFGKVMQSCTIRNDIGIIVEQCLNTKYEDRPNIESVIQELQFYEFISKVDNM